MDKIIRKSLSELKLGELQSHNGMSARPLFSAPPSGPDYVMLKDALENKNLRVTEVNDAGSVPELKAENKLDAFILLLDGEELTGAKQNRIVNTSILLEPRSETVIPVSCTEQGRWGYASPDFSYSDTVMSSKARARKSSSVSSSYALSMKARSDQSEVWAEIASLHTLGRTSSRTGAMKDAYDSRKRDLDSILESFPCQDGQTGVLVYVDGKPGALEFLSRADRYQKVHNQLIRSYAIDAMLERGEDEGSSTVEDGQAFVDAVGECGEQRFESVGAGHDFRFAGRNLVGSALVHEECVVHASFFGMKNDGQGRRAGRHM